MISHGALVCRNVRFRTRRTRRPGRLRRLVQDAHRSSGFSPVLLAIRARSLGPTLMKRERVAGLPGARQTTVRGILPRQRPTDTAQRGQEWFRLDGSPAPHTEEVFRNEYRSLAEACRSIERFLEQLYPEKLLHPAPSYRPPAESATSLPPPVNPQLLQSRRDGPGPSFTRILLAGASEPSFDSRLRTDYGPHPLLLFADE